MNPLVCIFAHPDDEAFGPAGSIAHFATMRDVYVICVTCGDAGHDMSHHLQKPLHIIRQEELKRSAKILGVKEVIQLTFKDGSLCNNSYHELAQALESEITRLKADSVLTFDMNGISGHIDHIAVSLVVTYLFRKMPKLTTLYYYHEPEDVIKQYRDGYFIYMPPGITPSDTYEVIDTGPYWEKRLEAMHAHESQCEDAEMILKVITPRPKREYLTKLSK